ncbi:MAG: lnt [Glaciihabitans sp.]|nr:lnt [Glaciihabitans sp.]
MTPAPTAAAARPPLLPLWAALPIAAASGPILDAGFPDRGWWPLTFVSIALVLVALVGRRIGAALLVGFISGLCFYLVQIDWASLFLGLLPMTALSVLESLFVAAGAMLITLAYRWLPRVWPSRLGGLALLPITVAGIWTAREAIDSTWPYGGFSWGRVAMSQSESPFIHLFSWFGMSGVSFLIVAFTALVVELVRWEARKADGIRRLTRALIAVGALAVLLIIPAFPVETHGTVRVAAVQGNGKAGYFDRRNVGDLLRAQYDATVPLFGQKVDMVVWPEGSSDIDPLADPSAAKVFDFVSTQMNAPLVAGIITQRGDQYFNESVLWKAGKGAVDYYDKKHPVPFGEYVPDRSFWRPFAPDLIDLIGREYTPGTTDTTFDINGVIAGIDICFDITDDGVIADSVQNGAQLLLAQTNNADFGRTDESVQQLAIARIRALEFGRSVVNISTVGTSAIIAPDGHTITQLKTYVPATMLEDVPLSTTITPATFGSGPFALLVSGIGLGALLVAGTVERRRRRA